MAIAWRSANQPAVQRAATATTQTQAFGSDILAGSTIMVAVGWARLAGLPTMTVSDNLNAGNYTGGVQVSMAGGLAALRIFYKENSAAGPCTVTATAGNAGTAISVTASEFTPNVSSAPFDADDGGAGTADVNNPSFTLTTIAAITGAYAGLSCTGAGPTAATAGSGWTEIIDACTTSGGTLVRVYTEWQRFTSAGGKTMTCTWDSADSDDNAISGVSLSEDSASTAAPRIRRLTLMGVG
jgi:hypothetical protein